LIPNLVERSIVIVELRQKRGLQGAECLEHTALRREAEE
jgi:hypothetical protein